MHCNESVVPTTCAGKENAHVSAAKGGVGRSGMDTTTTAWRVLVLVACLLTAGAAHAQSAYPPPTLAVSVGVGEKVAI